MVEQRRRFSAFMVRGALARSLNDESGAFPESFALTRLNDAVQWARKYSFFAYPFVTACCGMEYFSVSGPRYDLDRFGAALPNLKGIVTGSIKRRRPSEVIREHPSFRGKACGLIAAQYATVLLENDCAAGLFVTGRGPLKATVIVSLAPGLRSHGTVGLFA